MCQVPPREPFEKMLCQGCSPNGKWPGAQTFRSEAPCSELCVIGKISPDGSKLCPQGAILFFSLLPSSSDTLGPRDPKFCTPVHVSKGYPNMHNLWGQKIGGQNFGFLNFVIFSFFLSSLHNSSKNAENDIFWKFEILTPLIFLPRNLHIFWKPLSHSILVPKFVKFRQRVSELEGIRLKHKIVPCGHNFDPSGSSFAWHVCHTRAILPWKFEVSATSPALHTQTSHPRSFG